MFVKTIKIKKKKNGHTFPYKNNDNHNHNHNKTLMRSLVNAVDAGPHFKITNRRISHDFTPLQYYAPYRCHTGKFLTTF